jgi:hypothetical protein
MPITDNQRKRTVPGTPAKMPEAKVQSQFSTVVGEGNL